MAKKKIASAHKNAPHPDRNAKTEGPVQTLPELARIQWLLGRMKLNSIRLTESSAKLSIHGGQSPTEFRFHVETSLGVVTEQKRLIGNVRLTVEPKETSTEPDKPQSSVTMTALMQCIFDVEAPGDFMKLGDEDSRAMNSIISHIAWPYMRQHVFSITSSMGIPPLTLPLMQIRISGNRPAGNSESVRKE